MSAYPFPAPDAFKGQFGEKLDFAPAPDLRAIADLLIERHGVRFGHLLQLRVEYLWRRSGGASAGKLILGKCQKPSGLLGFYSQADFVVWLAWDHGIGLQLDALAVEAALFHELCHAGISPEDDETPELRPHDVEMFAGEVQEYGLWKRDLECLRQLGLFERQVVDRATGEVLDPAALGRVTATLTQAAAIAGTPLGQALTGQLMRLPDTPHLHRRQDEKYPAAVCSEAGCALEPKYAIGETTRA